MIEYKRFYDDVNAMMIGASSIQDPFEKKQKFIEDLFSYVRGRLQVADDRSRAMKMQVEALEKQVLALKQKAKQGMLI